ncbi:hypothetical protein [Kribbella sp. NPDC051620]|uniref:hypothetical protein n=1 Tax=Kribbella sp. NPDC051620 TaxID=3364120 RepID=UPI00378AC9D6
MSKFLGFLLGIAVALVGPAMFGVLAADGGIKLNAKEMALAYGIGALIFWAVVSYFSGAAAIGAALTFGAMIYTVHWIPNRMTNFLNDVPGVTTGMIDGIKQYTGNGVVPILAVISLVFGIQSIVRSVQRRRRERVEAERRQREQEAAVQAQQMPQPPVAGYPVAGGDYQPDDRFGNNFGNSNYDDLFEEEPAPFTPRNQADEQTAQFSRSEAPAEYDDDRDETRLVPTDADETVMVPAGEKTVADSYDEEPAEAPDEVETQAVSTDEAPTTQQAAPDEAATQQVPTEEAATQHVATEEPAEAATQRVPMEEPAATQRVPVEEPADAAAQPVEDRDEETVVPVPEPEAVKPVAPRVAGGAPSAAPQVGGPQGASSQGDDGGEATQPMPVARPEAPKASLRKEEMGQQYRERMDPPDVDDTGEFFVGAFENPPAQTTQRMELPGQFRS